jgi:hypothetical protein
MYGGVIAYGKQGKEAGSAKVRGRDLRSTCTPVSAVPRTFSVA